MDETPPNTFGDPLANVTRGPRRVRQRLRFDAQQQQQHQHQTPQRTTRSAQAATATAAAQEPQVESRRAALRSQGSGFTPEPRPETITPPVNPMNPPPTMSGKLLFMF
ncbi:hypothetical protein B0T20DRAFT_480535 [Sordaria brevicollis]|uniref:Uncharacterized protein n=1 Tax=Sordaria brevicollis TaxID=83679 RepID=A0AAE0PBK7_SORBR|nr:hypothetical protein B0T20DRAFT_480535 [Sordaria brevicollis]